MSFPNLKGKHAKDSMFTPHDFLAYMKKIGKAPKYSPPAGVIFCYHNELLDYIAVNHKTTQVETGKAQKYLLGDTKNKVMIVGRFGIGSPVVCTILEEMIAFGTRRFMSIGTAGTLQKHIPIGGLMVCDRAIRDEGTSHHYLKPSKYSYASKYITKRITHVLGRLDQPYFVGTSWTTDAPYRETVAEARQYQKEGVATVEMEASALFAVAKYHNVQLGSIFTISDSLAELQWTPKFHSKAAKQGLETLYKVAADVLLEK